MRALISVWDKTGLDGFVKGLASLGWELVASGGTAAYIEELGLKVTSVESLTEFPEMLGGRVKTLHPAIHAGILARRGVDEDLETIAKHGIEPIDLVCVNLYPVRADGPEPGGRREAGRGDDRRRRADVAASGGEELRARDPRLPAGRLRERSRRAAGEGRRSLPGHPLATCFGGLRHDRRLRRLDRTLVRRDRSSSRESFIPVFEKVTDLPYGENPHQGAAYYSERGARTHLLARVEQLHGRELSFNNLNDLNAARLAVREFALPACVIVKHANPCGVGVGATIDEAYARALAADPISAYGGVVVLNRGVSAALGDLIAEQFVEVLFAPGYDEVALEALVQKQSIRILNDLERRTAQASERDFKRVLGGLLVQDRDWDVADREGMEAVVGKPSRGDLGRPALRVARLQARRLERDRDREGPADDRDRRRSDEPRRRGPDRGREGGRARPLTRGSLTGLGRVLPVPGRPAPGARRGRDRADPARRLEARRRGDRGGEERRRRDGLHRAPALSAH